MNKNRRQIVGKWGEDIAEQMLIRRGYKIIGRNIRTLYGEIDLIADDGNAIVFIEVKTRSLSSFGFPEASITKKKYLHLQESAVSYLQEHAELIGDWRIDVISIEGRPDGPTPKITWFENVVS